MTVVNYLIRADAALRRFSRIATNEGKTVHEVTAHVDPLLARQMIADELVAYVSESADHVVVSITSKGLSHIQGG